MLEEAWSDSDCSLRSSKLTSAFFCSSISPERADFWASMLDMFVYILLTIDIENKGTKTKRVGEKQAMQKYSDVPSWSRKNAYKAMPRLEPPLQQKISLRRLQNARKRKKKKGSYQYAQSSKVSFFRMAAIVPCQ